jgi:signal transduction histidine kinase
VAKKQVSGTGLGLYIVNRILEKHGGKLEFESQEKMGSIFFFTLPFSTK